MPKRGAASWALIAVIVAGATLLSFHLLRTAAVADRVHRPELAAALWPSHPAVLTDRALLAIAVAAARGRPAPAGVGTAVRRIAVKAPLSPDPFLIEGAIAQMQGRSDESERLLLAARQRDPRSRGARYLLAERYFKTGRVTAALIEMQALVSLQSRGAEAFVPALVAFSRTPGAVPQLKAFFARYPQVESAVLSVLALEPANAGLVLALASGRRPDPDWRPTLVSVLANAGEYDRAYAAWSRLSGLGPSRGLFNPAFADLAAPPPFNWDFPDSGEGVAEPDGAGGVRVLYYGRSNAVLIRQLMLLPPGPFALAMRVADVGGDGAAVRWTVRCAGAQGLIGQIPLREGQVSGTFAVQPTCAAQWLELQGMAGEVPRTTELTIRDLQLAARAGQ
jgi:tetratricopeptide (TPR) repeat protein